MTCEEFAEALLLIDFLAFAGFSIEVFLSSEYLALLKTVCAHFRKMMVFMMVFIG